MQFVYCKTLRKCYNIDTIKNMKWQSSTEKAKVRGGGGYQFCFSLLKYEKVNGKMNKIWKNFCAMRKNLLSAKNLDCILFLWYNRQVNSIWFNSSTSDTCPQGEKIQQAQNFIHWCSQCLGFALFFFCRWFCMVHFIWEYRELNIFPNSYGSAGF